MPKAVVMQVTDIKNRQQDMNTRQLIITSTHAICPLRRIIRTLPKPWLAALIICCLMATPLPGFAASAQPGIPPVKGALPAHAQAMELSALSDARTDGRTGGRADQAPSQTPNQPADANSGVDDQGRAAWRELEPGLLFGEFQLNDSDARLTVLRIDPAYFAFTLCARSKDGGPSRPLNQWGEQYDLVAAINASMYLPDGSTSTGYMRQGDHVNNGRIVQRFGAFFVAGPDEQNLPQAAILDRDGPLWRQQMDHYSLVIQNYRMINADRRILWSPGGPHYSISAVAQDGDGQILFMHCRQSVEAYSFAQQVLHLPLNVRTVMYVEGGGQAGLLVRSAALTRELVGLSPSGLLVTGDLRAVLPNVLGARRKTDLGDRPGSLPASAAQPPAAAPVAEPALAAPADSLAPSATQAKPEAAPTAPANADITAQPANSAAKGSDLPKDTAAEGAPAVAPLTEPGTSLAPARNQDP